MKDNGGVQGVQSVVRAFSLVELLCKNGKSGITELSKASGLSKTTVFRLIETLSMLGYVVKDSGSEKYQLTLKFLQISGEQLAAYDIRKQLRPTLERLAEACGETVHLVERNNNDIVYIDKIEIGGSTYRMASHIGLTLPMIYTASGKAILSGLGDSEVKAVWDSSEIFAKTSNTIVDYKNFIEEINGVRKSGIATDDEENELGVSCIAAPVRDNKSEYNYAVSVSVPAVRMDEKKAALIKKLLSDMRY